MKLWSLLVVALMPASSLAADSPPNPGTAFITGSDRGIGFALVQEFETRGWQVIATARDPAKATELSAFAKAHPRVTVEKLDVTDTVASVESLASAGYPNSYFYAMSKAALNMGLREFALDPGAKRGVTTVLISPGAVDTDMQRGIRADMAQAGKPITLPTRTPAEVAHAMVLAIEQLTPEQNGKFFSLSGKEVPW
jgi:NAD(P)-dependent dehydrogenase (short-subunit alcohol dehydrogenase family)